MLKIKDNVNLNELENFGFKKEGGTLKEHYYHYKYTKFKQTLFSTYEIIIDINRNRRISIIQLTSPIWTDEEYYDNPTVCRNGYDVTALKKRYIKDLTKAGLVEKASDEMSVFSEKNNKNELIEFDILKILNDMVTKYKHFQYTKIPIPSVVSKEIQALEGLLKLYNKEKEKNGELLQEIKLNQAAINIANNQLCNYELGYQDGLHREITATEMVIKERENYIIQQHIKRLKDTIYELHKLIDEGNKKVAKDYISKDRIINKMHELQEAKESLGNEGTRIYDFTCKILEELLKGEGLNERN